MNDAIEWIGFIVGVASFAWALMENYKRQKMKQVLKTLMQTYPGDLAKIEQSCTWAWAHSRDGLRDSVNIPQCPAKASLMEHLNLATGDAAAAARMCHILFNQLLAFQQAQFNTRNIIHAEKGSLDLTRAELNSQAQG